MIYKTKGTCSTMIDVELKDGVIDSVKFTGGCNGNLQGISALVKGKTDESYQAINTGIDLEMSWLNYVLLGKVYEMKGMNREAADAYLTAFNLRPGANTLYWIENGIFQTSVPYVVPYLDKFLASE